MSIEPTARMPVTGANRLPIQGSRPTGAKTSAGLASAGQDPATGTPSGNWLLLNVSDEAKRKYEEGQQVADNLAKGAAAAKNTATNLDLQSKKQRLRILKMLADLAIAAREAKAAKAIAQEIAQIAKELGDETSTGGDSPAADAAASATGDTPAADAAASATGDTPAADAAASAARATDGEASADPSAATTTAAGTATPTDGKATASQATTGDQSASNSSASNSSGNDQSGSDQSVSEQVRELLQLARKILDKLRHAFASDRTAGDEIRKAGQAIQNAAIQGGIDLSGQGEGPGDAGTAVTTSPSPPYR